MMERRGKGIGPTCFVRWRGEEKALVQLVLCGGGERERHPSSLLCVVERRGEGISPTCLCGGVEMKRHRFNL